MVISVNRDSDELGACYTSNGFDLDFGPIDAYNLPAALLVAKIEHPEEYAQFMGWVSRTSKRIRDTYDMFGPILVPADEPHKSAYTFYELRQRYSHYDFTPFSPD